jgi:predicted amidophosphoribosyltransferase
MKKKPFDMGEEIILPQETRMNCSFCGGELNYLGRLGFMDWLRCEACGMDQAHSAHGDGPSDLRSSEDVYEEEEA